VRNLIRSNPLVAYFAIAFGVTWLSQIPGLMVAEANDQSISNEDNLQHLFDLVRGRLSRGKLSAYLLFFFGAGPLIGAFVVLQVTRGREGVRDLLRRIAKWRVDPALVLDRPGASVGACQYQSARGRSHGRCGPRVV
jgi:hypothetical protein